MHPSPSSPLNAPERLTALRATGLLDGERSPVLDGLARAAARLADAPAAFALLIGDAEHAVAGDASAEPESAHAAANAPTAAQVLALAARVVASAQPLLVEDAGAEPGGDVGTFAGAFAGTPLTTGDGLTLGTLCVADARPRGWSTEVMEGLRDLAAAAVAELACRRTADALHESETRFRQIAESIGEVFWLADPEANRVLYVSPAFERLWGLPAEEFYADITAIAPLIHPDDLEATLAAFERMRRLEQREVEYRIVRRDGAVRWVSNRSFAVRDAAGRIIRTAGVASDVTDRKRAEGARRAQQERFRALVEHATDVTGVLAPDGTILYESPAVERVLGYTPEEMVGRLGFDFVHPDDVPELKARLDEVLRESGAATSVRYRCRHRDGSWRTLEAHGWNLVDHPDVLGVVLNARDITDREALEARLRQAEKLEAVGQLAGGVAHDFNNLLTVIVGNLEFVRNDYLRDLPPSHPAHADIADIAAAAERARGLVRQLLAFSRQQVTHPQRVDVGDVVQRAEGLLQRVIGEEIVLAVHVADIGAPGRLAVMADAGRLEQVLMNLVVNARDAMLTPLHGRPGIGGTLEIEVDAVTLDADQARAHDVSASGRWVRVRVRDTGHGMDQETRAHAFEPFFTTKEVGRGTGLGLATVFAVVRQAGGSVDVDSMPGGGTTVTVLLPAAEEDADGAGTPRAASRAPDAPATGIVGPVDTAPATAREAVLLVEDEATVRAMARRVLARHGYAVHEARHGADALLLWRAHGAEIAVVVTDLRMPEMGGRELVARLRAERPTLPVVTMSGYAKADEAAEGGPHDLFLAKPFTAAALLEAVARALGTRRPTADRGVAAHALPAP